MKNKKKKEFGSFYSLSPEINFSPDPVGSMNTFNNSVADGASTPISAMCEEYYDNTEELADLFNVPIEAIEVFGKNKFRIKNLSDDQVEAIEEIIRRQERLNEDVFDSLGRALKGGIDFAKKEHGELQKAKEDSIYYNEQTDLKILSLNKHIIIVNKCGKSSGELVQHLQELPQSISYKVTELGNKVKNVKYFTDLGQIFESKDKFKLNTYQVNEAIGKEFKKFTKDFGLNDVANLTQLAQLFTGLVCLGVDSSKTNVPEKIKSIDAVLKNELEKQGYDGYESMPDGWLLRRIGLHTPIVAMIIKCGMETKNKKTGQPFIQPGFECSYLSSLASQAYQYKTIIQSMWTSDDNDISFINLKFNTSVQKLIQANYKLRLIVSQTDSEKYDTIIKYNPSLDIFKDKIIYN